MECRVNYISKDGGYYNAESKDNSTPLSQCMTIIISTSEYIIYK